MTAAERAATAAVAQVGGAEHFEEITGKAWNDLTTEERAEAVQEAAELQAVGGKEAFQEITGKAWNDLTTEERAEAVREAAELQAVGGKEGFQQFTGKNWDSLTKEQRKEAIKEEGEVALYGGREGFHDLTGQDWDALSSTERTEVARAALRELADEMRHPDGDGSGGSSVPTDPPDGSTPDGQTPVDQTPAEPDQTPVEQNQTPAAPTRDTVGEPTEKEPSRGENPLVKVGEHNGPGLTTDGEQVNIEGDIFMDLEGNFYVKVGDNLIPFSGDFMDGSNLSDRLEALTGKSMEDILSALRIALGNDAQTANIGTGLAEMVADEDLETLLTEIRDDVAEQAHDSEWIDYDPSVVKGVDDATGRLEETSDDLLNELAEGAADLLPGTPGGGSYDVDFLKTDKTPPTPGTTEGVPPGDTNKMTPGQTPDGAPDDRSAGDRLRDAGSDRISDRGANRPGTGGSGGGGNSTSGGTSGGGAGTGGTTSGVAGGADVMPTPMPSTGATSGGAGGAAAPGAGTGTPTGPSADDDGFEWAAVKIDDQWYDSEGNPIDDATAEQILAAQDAAAGEAAAAGDAAAGEAAAAESDASKGLEYSTDRFDTGPTGVDTGTGRMVDEMVQQYRDIADAARAGSQVNPVREGVEVGRMTLDDLPTARDLQQPPPGEGFVDGELVDRRGPDYSSSTGAGVINDPNMTSGPDGPTKDPADLDVGRAEDLGHLADGITGGTPSGAGRTGPPPSGVDPADLRIGDPIDLGRATVPLPAEQPAFGSGASGEAYTTEPIAPKFGAGETGETAETSDGDAPPDGAPPAEDAPADDDGTTTFGDGYISIGSSEGLDAIVVNEDHAVEPEAVDPEPEPEPEPATFEPAPMYAIGDPVAASGGGSTTDPSESAFDWSANQNHGLEHLDRGIEGLGDLDRFQRTTSDTTIDDDLGDAG